VILSECPAQSGDQDAYTRYYILCNADLIELHILDPETVVEKLGRQCIPQVLRDARVHMMMVLALADTLIRLKQGDLLQRLRTVQSKESQAAVADPID
jgi:hypothetical protein